MNLERYIYFTTEDYLEYEFFSEGPKGKIKKVVRYIRINEDPVIYNLGFGDYGDEAGNVDDSSVSNNQDRDLVLATVANTVFDFTKHYNDYYVFATGSTAARTRLYQIGISKFVNEIKLDFEIFGLKKDLWEDFKTNVNYDGFLIKKK